MCEMQKLEPDKLACIKSQQRSVDAVVCLAIPFAYWKCCIDSTWHNRVGENPGGCSGGYRAHYRTGKAVANRAGFGSAGGGIALEPKGKVGFGKGAIGKLPESQNTIFL